MTQTKEFWKRQYKIQVEYLTQLYLKALAEPSKVRAETIQSATAQAIYFKEQTELKPAPSLFIDPMGKWRYGYMPTNVDELTANIKFSPLGNGAYDGKEVVVDDDYWPDEWPFFKAKRRPPCDVFNREKLQELLVNVKSNALQAAVDAGKTIVDDEGNEVFVGGKQDFDYVFKLVNRDLQRGYTWKEIEAEMARSKGWKVKPSTTVTAEKMYQWAKEAELKKRPIDWTNATLEDVPVDWMPKSGEPFWFLAFHGGIGSHIRPRSMSDLDISRNCGRVFPTEYLCKAYGSTLKSK